MLVQAVLGSVVEADPSRRAGGLPDQSGVIVDRDVCFADDEGVRDRNATLLHQEPPDGHAQSFGSATDEVAIDVTDAADLASVAVEDPAARRRGAPARVIIHWMAHSFEVADGRNAHGLDSCAFDDWEPRHRRISAQYGSTARSSAWRHRQGGAEQAVRERLAAAPGAVSAFRPHRRL